jgi:hypothetical protein
MVPAEIFELIGNVNYNLYITCKSFYQHISIYYMEKVANYNKLTGCIFGNFEKVRKEIIYNPEHIYHLKNVYNNNLLEFNNLTFLEFLQGFNEPLDHLIELPIKKIIFGSKIINKPKIINRRPRRQILYTYPLPILSNLKYLEINYNYTDLIPLFPCLTELILDDNYNLPLPCFKTLCFLKLGEEYNQPLPNYPLLNNIVMGEKYNQLLPNFRSLTNLVMGDEYNQPLPECTLKHLEIGISYNHKLDNLTRLEYLSINNKNEYNYDIQNISTLKYLNLNKGYNNPLPELPQLEYLYIDNDSLFNYKLPRLSSLIHIKLNNNFHQALHPMSNLEILHISSYYNHMTDLQYYPKIKQIISDDEIANV